MAAIDFDDAMNESKRPRKDDDADRRKQERDNSKVPFSYGPCGHDCVTDLGCDD